MYLGDYTEDYADLNFKFTTRDDTGLPTTLSGTPAVSVYKSNSATQSTAGITLSVDFDSVTGLNNVLIDLSADAFYETGEDYQVVITTGTVDSVSVVGEVVATFSIQNRYMRGTDSAYTGTPPSAAAIRSEIDSNSTQLAQIITDIGNLNDFDPSTNTVILATSQPNYAPAKAGDEMDLVDSPNSTAVTAIGTALEAMMLDEGDASALLAAISAKVEEFLINEGDATATLAAIASAVNSAVVAGTVGSNVAAIYNKLPSSSYLTGTANSNGSGYSTHSAANVVSAMNSDAQQLTLQANASLAATRAATLLTNVADVPTVAEFEARTLEAGDYFDPSEDVVSMADVYWAEVQFTRDQTNTKDEWTVFWIKNGVPVTSGITSPQIQVVNRSDGSDLVAATSMSQIGSTGSYKYDEDTNRVTVGEAVLAVVTATIDGSSRPWRKLIGRDSS